MDNKKLSELKVFAAKLRIDVLEMLLKCGSGHLGGSLSLAELMSVLYCKQMKIDPENPRWEERDRLVLSKGHCGPVLYSSLAEKGFFPKGALPRAKSCCKPEKENYVTYHKFSFPNNGICGIVLRYWANTKISLSTLTMYIFLPFSFRPPKLNIFILLIFSPFFNKV